jgi:plastocyanin/mono/diheme cytochrome c family protein
VKHATFAAFVLAATALGGCRMVFGPRTAPASPVRVPRDDVTVERGRYLAENVADCLGCHSSRDWRKFSGPALQGARYAGGECYTSARGFPGHLCAPNISPSASDGIGAWSDGEVIRAVREGIHRDGHALFPIMPYPHYRGMSDRDVEAVVAFLRTVQPAASAPRERSLGFPLGLIVRTIPEPVDGAVPEPPPRGPEHGKYLAKMADCAECHTPHSGHSIDESRLFAGGYEIRVPGTLHVVSPNLTPDVETGLGTWTKEAFIRRFKAHDVDASVLPEVPPERQTAMPWKELSGMTEQDLGDIYAYLRSLPAIRNRILTTVPDAPAAPPIETAPVAISQETPDAGTPAPSEAAPPPAASAPAPAPSPSVEPGDIVGTVKLPSGKPARWAVVYLEDGPREDAKPATAWIDNRQMVFAPYVSVVTVGGRVTFHNSDPFPHNVFAVAPERFDMGLLQSGEARSRVFTKTGGYALLCNMHPSMLAYLFVSPSSVHAIADGNGAYRLKGVPGGSWRIGAWAPRMKAVEAVTVSGGELTVDLTLEVP